VPDDEGLLGCVAPAEFEVDDEQPGAAMRYPSGTTGRPDGVVYTNRSITLHLIPLMAAAMLGLTAAAPPVHRATPRSLGGREGCDAEDDRDDSENGDRPEALGEEHVPPDRGHRRVQRGEDRGERDSVASSERV
jgi:hypothetical protein